MKAEEFFRYLADANFDKLVGDNKEALVKYVSDLISHGKSKLVIRFLLERKFEDSDIPTPYYIWAVYELNGDDEELGILELYPPDFSNLKSYLEIPDELRGEEFFEISIP